MTTIHTTITADATPSVLRRVEEDLLRGVGGRGVAWCGRAATALYWAFRMAGARAPNMESPEVILPAISCATPAHAALLGGLTPRFADVDPDSGQITLESIRARSTGRTKAVVFIHLYGQTADLTEISKWCRRRGIVLIEDAAQALGGVLHDGRAVGSYGDVTVYSFNATKILECGGGALVIRSNDMWEAWREERARSLPPEPEEEVAAQLALSYRNLHHALVGLMRARVTTRVSDLFLGLRAAYEPLYLRRMRSPEKLANAWMSIGDALDTRLSKARIFSAELAGGPWKLLNGWAKSGVCWRYSLLVDFPERLLPFSGAVRRDGFHVSNLYWPVNEFFLPGDVCPNADAFARRIVNLWVDSTVSEETVRHCAASVLRRAS